MDREYYNRRHGHVKGPGNLLCSQLVELVIDSYQELLEEGYLQQAFGYYCSQRNEDVKGRTGQTLQTQLLLKTGIDLNKLPKQMQSFRESHLFSFIEFIFDYVAEPDEMDDLPRCNDPYCGTHYDPRGEHFSEAGGKQEWRERVNPYLRHYEGGYELSPEGEVRQLAPQGFEDLLEMPPSEATPENEQDIIDRAIKKFRNGKSTRQDRKDAIGELYKILERHRKNVVKLTFTKTDNKVLFGIANEFTIRHYRDGQLDDYDDSFLDWLFYVYLSTVHLVLELAHETDRQAQEDESEP